MGVEVDERVVVARVCDRVDRLMRSIQNEVKDSDLRFDLITRLISIRERLNAKKSNV